MNEGTNAEGKIENEKSSKTIVVNMVKISINLQVSGKDRSQIGRFQQKDKNKARDKNDNGKFLMSLDYSFFNRKESSKI